MAHKKGQGSSRNGRESAAQRLGVKKCHGEPITEGAILIRQRGTKWHPGKNVKRAKDDTLFALTDGFVVFEKHTHRRKNRTFASVVTEKPTPKTAS